MNNSSKQQDQKQGVPAPYQPPAVVYEGTISTRAGSPLGTGPADGPAGADPADLFGDD